MGRSVRIPSFSEAGALLLNFGVVLCHQALSLRLVLESIVIKRYSQPV